LTDKLAAIKAPIAEEDQVVTLLGSLPSSYSTLVTALEARDNISLSYVQQLLVHEEQRLKGKNKPNGSMDARNGTGQTLVGKQNFQKGGGYQHKKVCYLCGVAGHFHRDCPKNRYQKFSKPKHKAKPACMESHEETKDDEGAFAVPQTYNSGSWIVDSGVSSYMTHAAEFLVDYEEFDNPQNVCLGDGQIVEALRRGNIYFTIVFKMSKPKKATMYNVLYVPKLPCNLFSVKAAATKGNAVKSGNNSCWIRDGNGRLLGIGALVDKLYYLDCSATIPEHAAIIYQDIKLIFGING